jgi:hypothetical protein
MISILRAAIGLLSMLSGPGFSIILTAPTTRGEIQTYLGCEIERDIAKGTTSLHSSQKHYAEEVLRT